MSVLSKVATVILKVDAQLHRAASASYATLTSMLYTKADDVYVRLKNKAAVLEAQAEAAYKDDIATARAVYDRLVQRAIANHSEAVEAASDAHQGAVDQSDRYSTVADAHSVAAAAHAETSANIQQAAAMAGSI